MSYRTYLEAWDFTPAEFAERHSLATELIECIIAGTSPIDVKLATIFGREFSLEADFWLDIEAEYRQRLAQKAEADTAA